MQSTRILNDVGSSDGEVRDIEGVLRRRSQVRSQNLTKLLNFTHISLYKKHQLAFLKLHSNLCMLTMYNDSVFATYF